MIGILYGIASFLVLLWLIGFALHIGGGLIHIILVVAVCLFLFNLVTGRGAKV